MSAKSTHKISFIKGNKFIKLLGQQMLSLLSLVYPSESTGLIVSKIKRFVTLKWCPCLMLMSKKRFNHDFNGYSQSQNNFESGFVRGDPSSSKFTQGGHWSDVYWSEMPCNMDCHLKKPGWWEILDENLAWYHFKSHILI